MLMITSFQLVGIVRLNQSQRALVPTCASSPRGALPLISLAQITAPSSSFLKIDDFSFQRAFPKHTHAFLTPNFLN